MGIVDEISKYSETFPKLPASEFIISRKEEIEQIKKQFESYKIVYLTGGEGVGLTTALALFTQRYKAISYFIDGFSASQMDSQYIEKSINFQLEFYNKHLNFDPERIGNFQSNIMRAKKAKKTLFFVFDGFYRISSSVGENLKRILSPILEMSNARILFSARGDDHEIIDSILSDYYKDKGCLNLFPFKEVEVKDHFSKISADEWNKCDEDLQNSIIDICAGNAEKISVIDSKIRLGISLETIGEIYTRDNGDIFRNDWYKYEDDTKANTLLALIAFSEMPMNQESILQTLNIDKTKFNELIDYCKDSLYINENGIIEFILPSFRKYVRHKLIRIKKEVEKLLIKYLEHNTSDLDLSTRYIPSLYNAVGQNKQLIQYLNQDNIIEFLIDKKSQAAINEQCDYGFKASEKVKQITPEWFRFAINRSASREIENNELYNSEIEALVAIGEIDNAYTIVQNIHLKEERLKCLLLIAKKKHKVSSPLFVEIEKDIETLIHDIDFEHIPEKAIRIAKLMLPIDLKTALSIIDRIAKASNDKEQFDKLYTEISLSYEEYYDDKDDPTKSDIISTRINDDGLKKMTIAMKSIMRDCTKQQLIEELEKMQNPEMSLYVLQFWIPNHQNHPEIESIVLYAIRLVIKIANTFIPKAELLCKFCSPLDTISEDGLDEIIRIIHAVEDTVKYPSINYADLQLMIIKSKSKFNIDDAFKDLKCLYDDICQFEDKAISVHCKSKILNTYTKINNYKYVENNWKTIDNLKAEIYSELVELLDNSAYHLKMVVGPIKELICDYGNDIVIPIINKMNTGERRSRAYYVACIEYIHNMDISSFDFDYFDLLYSRIEFDKSDRTIVLINLFERIIYSEKSKQINLSKIKSQYQRIKNLENVYAQCYLYSILYVWFKKNYPDDSLCHTIKNDLLAKWNKIDIQWEKISVGYEIAEQLSKLPTKDEAKEMIQETTKIKKSLSFGSLSSVTTFLISLNLYVESIGILIRSDLCSDNYLDQFNELIDYVASKSMAMILWSKIALEFYVVDNQKQFKAIVENHLLHNLNDLSTLEQKRVLYNIAPALFLYRKEDFYPMLCNYDECFKNQCLDVVFRFLINKFAYSEYTHTNSDYVTSISFCEYKDLLDIISHCQDENSILIYSEIICKSLKKYNRQISAEQKKELLPTLANIINNKYSQTITDGLPHNGYKIACLTVIECPIQGYDEKKLDMIKKEIETINNIADQSFLYSYISEYAKTTDQKRDLIQKGFEIANKINNSFDKISRFDMCLSESFESNLSYLTKELYNKESDWLLNNKNGNYTDAQRMIDLLQEYGERQDSNDINLVDDFIEKIDKDPARSSYRSGIKKYISTTKKIKSAKKDISNISELPQSELGSFFEAKLKSIINDTAITNNLDFNALFPIYYSIYSHSISVTKNAISYILEYYYMKNKKSNGYYKELLKGFHKALLYNLKIVLSLASETKEIFDKINSVIQDSLRKSTDTHIRAGQFDKAINTIKDWYSHHSEFDRLRIIVPHFSPERLFILKELMRINNNLNVKVLSGYYDNNNPIDIDDYQKFWNEISSELPGQISIYLCSYKDKKVPPFHDRYWLFVNSETREKKCLNITIETKRDTTINKLDRENISSVEDMWEDYVSNRKPKDINGEIMYIEPYPYNLH